MSAVAEVYPTLWSRRFARAGRTGDQHDAFSIAAWRAMTDRNGTLADAPEPRLPVSERAVARVEGWILGVTDEIDASGRTDTAEQLKVDPTLN